MKDDVAEQAIVEAVARASGKSEEETEGLAEWVSEQFDAVSAHLRATGAPELASWVEDLEKRTTSAAETIWVAACLLRHGGMSSLHARLILDVSDPAQERLITAMTAVERAEQLIDEQGDADG